MTDVTNFTTAEFTLALLVAVLAQAGGLLLLKSGGGTALHADISDERARPMSVAITPMVDDAPLLKLGSPKQPGKLPDRWIAPRPVERTAAAAFPSPHAQATPQAIPTAAVADAGQKAPSPDAEVVKSADLLLTVPDAGPLPVSTIEGAADGVKEGTETDPLKAHVISGYKAKLDAWFSSKFHIRGKIPFDALKDLRGGVQVNIGPERQVTGFTITKPSGNATFDDELRATLERIVASGAELPPPPPQYPDVLSTTMPLVFRCTNRSTCE